MAPRHPGQLLLLVCLCLAACARGPDGEQDDLCRKVVPAVFERGSEATVLISESGRAGEVFLRLAIPDATREHVLYCRFAGSGFSLRKRDLVGVAADGAPLSEAAVFFLRTGWLQTQDAIAAAPKPARGGGDGSARIGPATAYGLQQALGALPKAGIIVLLAAAYALLYGLIGRINLAFGAFAALGGVAGMIGVAVMEGAGVTGLAAGLAMGLASAIAVSAAFGLAAARLIIAPLALRPGQHLLIASAGLMIVLEEFLRLAQSASTRWLAPVLSGPVAIARAPGYDVTITPAALATFLTAGAAALLLLAFLRTSRFGRRWRAAADDPHAAPLFGIDMDRTVETTFALAAALAGLAGALVAFHYGGMGFAGGAALGLTALVAAILGGIGSVGGAMLGGLLIALAEAAWSATLPIEYRDVAIFSLLAIVLALKPDGIAGGRQPGPMRV